MPPHNIEIETLKKTISNQESQIDKLKIDLKWYKEIEIDLTHANENREDELEMNQATIAQLRYDKVIAELKLKNNPSENDKLQLTLLELEKELLFTP